MIAAPARGYRLTRLQASADLAWFVERHWVVEWDLPPGQTSTVMLLPHPCVNLLLDRGTLLVAGVGRRRFDYQVTGRGAVYGTKFRPGGFRPVDGMDVDRLTERTVPAAVLWADRPWSADLDGLGEAVRDAEEYVRRVEAFLRRRNPPSDPSVDLVGRVVQVLLGDRDVTRVEDVADRFGVSTRTLQRLFRRYVGVSPKWVLKRYRLHEAAARLADAPAGTWGQVAAEMGYYDQSHFIRDFTEAVGLSPSDYAALSAAGEVPLSA